MINVTLKIKKLDTLKTIIGNYNKLNCMGEIMKLKRDDLINLYKTKLKYTDIDYIFAKRSPSVKKIGYKFRGC